MMWNYFSDRKPTAIDYSILIRFSSGIIVAAKWDCITTAIAWMPVSDLPPLPPRKVWREPTQADLDAATEPIPCWVWDGMRCHGQARNLRAIDKFAAECKFITDNDVRFMFSEIEVDE